LYRDVRVAPATRELEAAAKRGSLLGDLRAIYKLYGLEKPWHVRTAGDADIDIKRRFLRERIVQMGLPESWVHCLQVTRALTSGTREDRGGSEQPGREDPVAAVLADLRTMYDAMKGVGFDPDAMCVERGDDLRHRAHAIVNNRIHRPECFLKCPDSRTPRMPSVAGVEQATARVHSAWTAYQAVESSEFGTATCWVWRFACDLPPCDLQDVVNHATIFNTLLQMLIRDGRVLDTDTYHIAVDNYIHLDASLQTVYEQVSLHLYLRQYMPIVRGVCLLQGHAAPLMTVMARVAGGALPANTPAFAAGLIIKPVFNRRIYVRQRASSRDAMVVDLRTILNHVDEVVFNPSKPALQHSGSFFMLRLFLAFIVAGRSQAFMQREGLTLTYGELQGLEAFLERGGVLEDIPYDIISFARL
jgi:hypothetical protein